MTFQAPPPPDEVERLAALRRYGILDTLPEQAFDDLALLAAHVCSVPIAFVGFIDSNRQWFKSKVGLRVEEIPRYLSLCSHAILSTELCVIRDALADERFKNNPLVTSEPHIRFYASAPLATPEGHVVGTLCVIDHAPRDLSPEQEESLRVLARQVMAQLELRHHLSDFEQTFLELARAHREVRFQARLLDAVEESVIATDLEGRIVYWNRYAERMYGWQAGEAVGRNVIDIIPQEASQGEAVEIMSRLGRGESWSGEFVVRRRDGSSFPAQVTDAPLYDGDGTLIGIVGISRDITELKRAEEALRRSQRFAQSIADTTPVITYLYDHIEDRNVYVNRALTRILGYTPEEVEAMGASLFPNLMHPDDLTTLPDLIHRLATSQDGEVIEHEYRMRNVKGEWRWLRSWTVVFSRTPDGRLHQVLGSAQDVTEYKEAEEALRQAHEDLERRVAQRTAELTTANALLRDEAAERRRVEGALHESEERFRLLLEGTKDYAILMLNTDGRIATWNEGATRLKGYLPNEIIGQHFSICCTPEDRAQGKPEQALKVAAAEGRFEDECWLERKDGSRFWANVNITALRDKAGGLRGFSEVVSDITERKRAEEAEARRLRRTAFRAEVSAAFAVGETLQGILRRCAEAICYHLDAAFARIWLLNAEENVLELCASAGMYTHLNGAHARIPVGQWKIGSIAAKRRPHLTNDVRHDPGVSDPEWAAREGMTFFAGYPLVVEDRLVGVMALFARETLDADTLEALRSTADVVAQGVERRRAEGGLKESEESYRRLVELSPDAVMVQSEGRIKYVNAAGIRLFGATRADQIVGKRIYDFVHPDYRDIVKERIRRAQAGERADFLEERFVRLDGQVIDVEVTGTGVTYLSKPATQVIVRDITERVRARNERMELHLRLIAAQEDERRRISRELHDQIGQYLPALTLGLKALEKVGSAQPGYAAQVENLLETAMRFDRDIHNLARELRPATLDEFGLANTLVSYSEEWSLRHGIAVDFHRTGFDSNERLPPHVETAFYRIAQEAFTNILKHAGAQNVSLILERKRQSVKMIVEDDGKGFDVEALMKIPHAEQCLGLLGMRERVTLVGGSLLIESTPGSGTTIVVNAPVLAKGGESTP